MAEEAREQHTVTRETPRQGEGPHRRSTFTPARRLLSDHDRARRDGAIALGVLLAGLLATLWSILAVRSEQRVFVVDPLGGTVQGPLEPLASSRGYFSITSINAAQAALQRSAVGFDLQEMLPLYFSARARRSLDADLEQHLDDLRRRHLTTKPVIDSITPPQPAGNARIVRVVGRLQSTGAVNGRVFYEEPPYELILVYRTNGDISNRASLPWVADEVELARGEAEVAKQRARNRVK